MRKKEIIDYILTNVNKRTDKQHNLNRSDIDAVIMSFRDCMIECVSRCEEFMFFNFLEVQSKVVTITKRRDPRTNERLDDIDRIKANPILGYKMLKDIRELEVTQEARDNSNEKKKEVIES